jgi:superfamily II RNA helicase
MHSKSLGKTYASYYAMSEVLKDKDGICVYVAPTIALVNQVSGKLDFNSSIK